MVDNACLTATASHPGLMRPSVTYSSVRSKSATVTDGPAGPTATMSSCDKKDDQRNSLTSIFSTQADDTGTFVDNEKASLDHPSCREVLGSQGVLQRAAGKSGFQHQREVKRDPNVANNNNKISSVFGKPGSHPPSEINAKASHVLEELQWTCSACTLEHCGKAKQLFLACELCGTARANKTGAAKTKSIVMTAKDETIESTSTPNVRQPSASASSPSMPPRKDTQSPSIDATTGKKRPSPWGSLKQPLPKEVSRKRDDLVQSDAARSLPSLPIATLIKDTPTKRNSWGSLTAPTIKDIRGKRKRQTALNAPPPLMDYLVVLDFEWTADDKQKMLPIPEITQFPSVVLKLVEKKKGIPMETCYDQQQYPANKIPLPNDLTMPPSEELCLRQDAFAIAAFDTFVRPTFNPILTDFSIQLTAITQEQVSTAPTMEQALQQYLQWLELLGLVVDNKGTRRGNWCFVTWGDGDIMSTLRQELQYKHIPLPACFDKWINLKCDSMFTKHYGREPRGGLRKCVESVGATWEGRAHNGLVDSINTAKIVRHMVQTGFRFTRATRGLDKDGIPFGQKRRVGGKR